MNKLISLLVLVAVAASSVSGFSVGSSVPVIGGVVGGECSAKTEVTSSGTFGIGDPDAVVRTCRHVCFGKECVILGSLLCVMRNSSCPSLRPAPSR